MNNEELKHYQECCLIIADEIDRICKKHNITYSIVGGTLLGAVRHQGFIPWDDDMDIGMLRNDYEKFITVCTSELDNKFHLLNWDTDKDFPFACTKITLKGTIITEEFARKNPKYNEIFVDIFPYDKLPSSQAQRDKIKRKVALYKKILWIKKGYGKCIKKEGNKKRAKYNFAKLVTAFIPYNYIKNKRCDLYKKYAELDFNSCFIADFEWPKTFKYGLTKADTFDSVKLYPYSNSEYFGFEKYNKYLKSMYGDYMTPPSEEKRHNHSINYIDFGEY